MAAPPPPPAPPPTTAKQPAYQRPAAKKPEPSEQPVAVVKAEDVHFKLHHRRVADLSLNTLAGGAAEQKGEWAKGMVFAFDLDNTLKYVSKTEQEPATGSGTALPKRCVRGGQTTLQSLPALRQAGALLLVLTARGPSKMKWETCVQELERLGLYGFFKDDRQSAAPKEFLVDGDSKVWGGAGVLVCHYYKPHALLAYLARLGHKATQVVFVDDFAVNVVSFGDHLVQNHTHAALSVCKEVSCLWFDPQPLIDAGELAPSNSENSYEDAYAPYLLFFSALKNQKTEQRQVVDQNSQKNSCSSDQEVAESTTSPKTA